MRIDFMGSFPSSYEKSYILLVVDYVSMWVKAIATSTNDAYVVVKFLKKKIFSRFGMPHAIISDEGAYFCNKLIKAVLENYGVRHDVALEYHPQLNSQAKFLKKG